MELRKELEQFLYKYDLSMWYEMTKEERLKIFQDFENHMASVQGRESYPVTILSQEAVEKAEARGGVLMGQFSSWDKEIFINPKFLTSRKSLGGISLFSLANGLDTIAHEGRHAFQHYVVDHPEKSLVDRDTRLSMKMNFACYMDSTSNPHPIYAGQLIELDARRYAKETLEVVKEIMEEREGHINKEFVVCTRKSALNEMKVATSLLKTIKAGEFEDFENKARVAMNQAYPGLDFSKASMFGDAIDFLKTKDMGRFVDGKPIRIRHQSVREKFDRQEIKPMRELRVKETKRNVRVIL